MTEELLIRRTLIEKINTLEKRIDDAEFKNRLLIQRLRIYEPNSKHLPKFDTKGKPLIG